MVVENYRPRIPIDPAWPTELLGEHIDFVSGLTLSIPDSEMAGGTPIISMNSITEFGELVREGIREIRLPSKNSINYLQKGDLLFNWRNGSKRLVGKTGYFDWDGEYVFASFLIGIRAHPQSFRSKFLWLLLNQYRADEMYMAFMRQNVNGLFNREELKILSVPVPDLNTQDKIVAEIEQEQALVQANRQLISYFQQKIRERIGRVWGQS
jgi:type I restriction enzyme M protein